jgi:hypothetical protein
MKLSMKTSDDLLIKDFYKIVEININDNVPRYDREIEMIKLLYPELSEDDIIDKPLEEVDEMIDSALNKSELYISNEIDILDRKFILKGNAEDFKFSFRQYKNLEKSVYQKKFEYIHLLMADIYVDDTPFEERAQFFYENMSMRYASFFLMKLPKVIENKIIR